MKEFKKEYEREEEEETQWQEMEEEKDVTRELPGKYIAKLLYRWGEGNMSRSIGRSWRKIGGDRKGIHL